MAAKTSPETRAEILKYWNAGGWSLKALERKFEHRRQSINENRRKNPPPSELKRRKEARSAPGLAKV